MVRNPKVKLNYNLSEILNIIENKFIRASQNEDSFEQKVILRELQFFKFLVSLNKDEQEILEDFEQYLQTEFGIYIYECRYFKYLINDYLKNNSSLSDNVINNVLEEWDKLKSENPHIKFKFNKNTFRFDIDNIELINF